VNQFGAEKEMTNIKDIQIMPEIFGQGQFFAKVKTDVKLGGFKCSSPVIIGALGSTKVASDKADALSEGAAKAGIVRVIGENVFPTFGKNGLKKMIDPFLKNYNKRGAIIVQANYHDEKLGVLRMAKELHAHAIQLKMGQGAKQGLGGEIQFKGKANAEKYKELGYMIVKHGEDTYERHAFPGSITKEGLRSVLKKYAEFNMPIWIKIAIGRGIIEFLKECEKIRRQEGIPLEAVVVDGFGGGTGMSPWLIMNELSIPSISLLKDKPDVHFDVIVSGGITSGMDIAKALMLGADGVGMGRAMLIAAASGAEGIANFVKAMNEELQMVAATLRADSILKIKNRKENLFALSEKAAVMFGLSIDPKDVL